MDILEAMTVRRSVRTYTGRPITALQAERIVAAISDAANPFGPAPYIKLISFGEERDLRPSTYGMIRGACDYLAMGYGGSEADALAAGFAMEQVVLEATRMGLGTCWIAATFRGSDFERKATWSREQPLKVVIPVGVAASKSLVERVARMAAGSDRRKPMDSLFFAPGFTGPLCGDSPFYEALAMMRLAPSSTNSQPCALRGAPTDAAWTFSVATQANCRHSTAASAYAISLWPKAPAATPEASRDSPGNRTIPPDCGILQHTHARE